MKKAQKEQAEQLIGLLDRVHDGIRMSVEAGQSENALDLLGQCQDGAISLGEMIEETEGEDCATVRLLEEYCETVYQIYEKIRQGQAVGGSKTQKILRKSLIPIKNSVKNDIQVRTEAVFLPYKASMWDSLESVWKAADEDPNCDAYVIPIPYYDKNPDGSFREEHYEGDQYPDYVPVTWYGDYDFAEHRPDRIFIHNPYDECNYVTSVHPFFYARNLKQYTDQLVYIPYFILSEVDPENTAAVKGMEHFCTTPGVIYADKVIVQSEDMRTVYVNVMTEFAKENGMEGMDRKYWEEKILGLGSPKVDKVLNTRREDLVIPGEWLRVIEKADGSWKKVVFYNTTVTALLKYGEQYLEKMRDVFRVFYENREDVALLWRPHPLMEATVKSMRAELWGEYEEIVREYKSAGWGIYDDSADLDRAVGVCDGYYGDGSSVIQLCCDAGMHETIQDPNANTEKEISKVMDFLHGKKKPEIAFTAKVGDDLYFVPADSNALFSIDLFTGKCDLKCIFKDEKRKGNFLGNAVSYNEYVIICPFAFSHIHVWDAKENQEKCIDESEIERKGPAYLPRMIVVDDKMLFFPSCSRDLYLLNINTWKVEQPFKVYQNFTKIYKKGFTVFSRDSGYIYNNKIYFSMSDTPYVAEYDIFKNDTVFYKLNLEEQIILSDGIREYLYLLSEKGIIYEWNIENQKLIKKLDIDCSNYDILRIQSTAKYEDNLYYLSPNDIFGIEYNVGKNRGKIEKYNDLFSFEDDIECHFSLQDLDGKLYFISEQYDLLLVDLKDRQFEKIKLFFDNKDLEKIWNIQNAKGQDSDRRGKSIYKTVGNAEG